MSELGELLEEFRRLREQAVPKSSRPVIFASGGQIIALAAYTDLVQFLPAEPGGILKQIFLRSPVNSAGLYEILVNDEIVISDLNFAGAGAEADLPLDFKRQKVNAQTKTGVTVRAKSKIGAITFSAIIHGEQVTHW